MPVLRGGMGVVGADVTSEVEEPEASDLLVGCRLMAGLAKRVAIRASRTFWPTPMLTSECAQNDL